MAFSPSQHEQIAAMHLAGLKFEQEGCTRNQENVTGGGENLWTDQFSESIGDSGAVQAGILEPHFVASTLLLLWGTL